MTRPENEIIYLACPYAHPDTAVRDWRYNTACRTAAQLIKQGYAVFSPLSHSLPIAKSGDLPDIDTGFWLKQDLLFLRLCGKVFVLTLPGWEESTGVRAEIAEAKKRNIPVMFIDREEITCATS